jgi:hypothetical protein
MARDTVREPIRHIVLSPRVVAVGILTVLLLAAGAGVYWQWRFALPAKTNDLPAIHAFTAEVTDGLAFDSPDNALVRYRALFMGTLGTPGAQVSVHRAVEGVGNDLFRNWVGVRVDQSLARLREGEWGDPRHDPIVQRMTEFRPILDGLDHAADATHFRARYTASGDTFNPSDEDTPLSAIEVLISHLSLARALGELNAAQLRVSANTGAWDDVVQRVRSGVRLSEHSSQEPFLLSLLVAATTEREVLEELRLVLRETSPPPGALDAMIDSIEMLDPPAPIATRLPMELLGLIASIRWEWDMEQGDMFSAYYWSQRLSSPPPRDSVRDARRYCAELAAYSSRSRAQRNASVPPDPGAAAYYMWSSDRVIDARDAQITERAGTLALLRILRFEREHGRLPRTLDEAMTTEQATDPVTGVQFTYLVGRDGMRAADPTNDAAIASAFSRNHQNPTVPVGERWTFTLHAPLEAAAYLKTVELTQRRAEIYIPPNATP